MRNPERPWLTQPIWAEIDLDALAFNVRAIKQWIGPNVELMAVVKADAYGHGAPMVSRVALQNGATRLACARVEEAVHLRKQGISAPVLILGYVSLDELDEAATWDITVPLMHEDVAAALSRVCERRGVVLPVHIKLETGMGRFGLLASEVVTFARYVRALPGLRLEGLYTQFAAADERDKTYTHQQFAIFETAVANLASAGISIPLLHVANSPTTLDIPGAHLNMVRCGLILYGCYPSADAQRAIPLRHTLAWKTRVGRVMDLPAGAKISYGCTFVTKRPSRVALLPVGYADGFRRALSNVGQVLIGGRRASILGRICMDQCVADITDIPLVQRDDEVVLIGRQGGEEITVDEVAERIGTISYEVMAGLGSRVPRVYRRDGRDIAIRTMDGYVELPGSAQAPQA